jgi:23S rRNA (pseudouridine1915-N3)-methyltransferase
MKIQLWSVGKQHDAYIKPGIDEFTKRLQKYFSAEWVIVPTPKNAAMLSAMDLKKEEAKTLLDWIEKDDYLVLLEEKGKMISSEELATFLQARANESIKQLIFLIGGVYGAHESILKRANFTWSLSKLVFPHMLVRLILAEQLYRACTILRNEKYHHV